MLDNFPKSSWFLCLPLEWGVFFIALLGVLHPVAWIRVMRVYRSEMFIFMYIIIYVWSALSVMLLYAILAQSSCIYTFWCYYTLAFGATMVGVMGLIFAGFCVIGKKRNSVFAMLALIYYCVTLYFVLVVNTQRRELFGLQQHDCGDESCNKTVQLKATGNTTYTKTETATSKKNNVIKPKKIQPVKKQIKPKKPKVHQTTEEEPEEETETTTPSETTETTPSDTVEKTPSDTVETTPSDTVETTTPDDLMERTALNEMMETTMSSETTKTTPRGIKKTKQSRTPNPVKKKEQMKKLGSRKAHEAGLFSAEESQNKEPPPYWDHDPVRDLEKLDIKPRAKEDRLARVTSDKCRMPRKPAHGRYEVHMGRSTLRLRLRCKKGYRENSVATECKYNWWDRPIPQCRKRRDPAPFDPDVGCVMPRYPAHGQYTVAAEPGERVGGDKVILQVTCDEPYRAVDPYVVCEGGQWRHAPPSCQKHCKLTFDPTVEYKCLKPFKDKFVSCPSWQPNGAIVVAACRSGHAHRGPFNYMRCCGDTWDHEVGCLPNANFTK